MTEGSKLSYSAIRERELFGSPIKTLFNTSGFNFKIKGAKQVDISKRRFFESFTSALAKFFERVDSEEESVPYTLGDPFTYLLRDTDNNKAKIYNFVKSDIGAFTTAGAQSIALTDRGVFFWGINPQAAGTTTFINLGKVSNFKGGPDFVSMVEVLNKVYVSDELGDTFVSIFNEANRNFMAKPSAEDAPIEKVTSGISFPGNRIMVVTESGKLYLTQTGEDGKMYGASEFEIPKMDIKRVEKFDNRVFVLGKVEG